MSHESAPATKLLATNCACCGRALVDSVSVETGIGPECRRRYNNVEADVPANWVVARSFLEAACLNASQLAEINDLSPQQAVNLIVRYIAVSRSAINAVDAQHFFSAIDALGFKGLAARIAKRWHLTIEIPAHFCMLGHSDCLTHDDLSRACRADQDAKAKAAAQSGNIVQYRAEYAAIRAEFCYDACTQIQFTAFVREMNPSSPAEFVEAASAVTCPCNACNATGTYRNGGTCFRCGGVGRQGLADVKRNRAYDRLNRARRTA